MVDCNDLSALLNAKCNKGHSLQPIVSRIAPTLFNIMAKNITPYENDKIHSTKSRSTSKETPDCRKICNICSS